VVPARIEKISIVPGEVADMCAKAMRIAERTTGRKLRMFKDKINFKFPGGGGFLAHQVLLIIHLMPWCLVGARS
jgi:hypothetical protein